MYPSPPSRLTRASAFAAVCVLLACLGHLSASGELMAPWKVAAGFAGALGVAGLLSGHERSLWTIMGGLLGGQFALHVLFTTGHVHGPGEQFVAPGQGSGMGMTVAHLLAAVVAAWWLRRGERAAWTFARRAFARLVHPLVLSHDPVVVAVPCTVLVVHLMVMLLRHVLVLRGPPARSWALSGS